MAADAPARAVPWYNVHPLFDRFLGWMHEAEGDEAAEYHVLWSRIPQHLARAEEQEHIRKLFQHALARTHDDALAEHNAAQFVRDVFASLDTREALTGTPAQRLARASHAQRIFDALLASALGQQLLEEHARHNPLGSWHVVQRRVSELMASFMRSTAASGAAMSAAAAAAAVSPAPSPQPSSVKPTEPRLPSMAELARQGAPPELLEARAQQALHKLLQLVNAAGLHHLNLLDDTETALSQLSRLSVAGRLELHNAMALRLALPTAAHDENDEVDRRAVPPFDPLVALEPFEGDMAQLCWAATCDPALRVRFDYGLADQRAAEHEHARFQKRLQRLKDEPQKAAAVLHKLLSVAADAQRARRDEEEEEDDPR